MMAGTQMGRTQKCPNCGHAARVKRTAELSTAIRDIIFQCTNDDCRARWGSMLSPDRLIQAPENPRAGFFDIFPSNRNRDIESNRAPPDTGHPDANGMASAACG
jgi:hypothetical protein